MTVHSLSQVHHTVKLLSAIIWQACDGDAARVAEAVEAVLGSGSATAAAASSSSSSSSAVMDSSIMVVGGVDGIQTSSSMDGDDAASDVVNDATVIRAAAVVVAPDDVPIGGNAGGDGSSEPPAAAAVIAPYEPPSFDDFKAGIGSQYNADYEMAKNVLRDKKSELKVIVGLVNRAKAEIDRLSEEMSAIESDENEAGTNTDARVNAKQAVDRAKAEYRKQYQKLTTLRSEVTDAQAQKQDSMERLVNAYNAIVERTS